jgi:hypothetical protein
LSECSCGASTYHQRQRSKNLTIFLQSCCVPRINVFPKVLVFTIETQLTRVRVWQVCGVPLTVSVKLLAAKRKYCQQRPGSHRGAVTWTTGCLYTTGHSFGLVKRICSGRSVFHCHGRPMSVCYTVR